MIIDSDYVIIETPEEAEQLNIGHILKEDEYIVGNDWRNGVRTNWARWGGEYPETKHAIHMRNVGGYVVRRPRRLVTGVLHPEAIHFI